MPNQTVERFKRWFWRPPRAHGDTIPDRTVSSLELFYDLLFVAVIAQAANHLAEHVSVHGFYEFALTPGARSALAPIDLRGDQTFQAGLNWGLRAQ